MMGGYGHRYMYYLTGLPGWMRYGFSPGWIGRSPTGLGPTASYMMTGQWPTPQAQAYWQAMQSGQAPYPAYAGMGAMPFGPTGIAPGTMPFGPTGAVPGVTPSAPTGTAPGTMPFGPQMTREQQLDMLKNQAQVLSQQLEQINKSIEDLEKSQE